MLPDRGADHRALSRHIVNGLEGGFGYAGRGIAMETLIESIVRVTIRHSDNAPIASEAATASVNRDEATGALRPLKPAVPGDRIMVRDPSTRGQITHNHQNIAGITGNIGARKSQKWRKHGAIGGYARYLCCYAR